MQMSQTRQYYITHWEDPIYSWKGPNVPMHVIGKTTKYQRLVMYEK